MKLTEPVSNIMMLLIYKKAVRVSLSNPVCCNKPAFNKLRLTAFNLIAFRNQFEIIK